MIGMVGMLGIFCVCFMFGVDWEKGDWGLCYGVWYYFGMKESCVFNCLCMVFDYYVNGELDVICKVGSNIFYDLQVCWSVLWNVIVLLGVNNLFNYWGLIMFFSLESVFFYYGGFDIGCMVYMKYQQWF